MPEAGRSVTTDRYVVFTKMDLTLTVKASTMKESEKESKKSKSSFQPPRIAFMQFTQARVEFGSTLLISVTKPK